MDNILRDGTQIDQTVFKDLNLNETASPAVSDFIVVPALYTGNLHIEIVAKEECEIHGEEITPEDEGTGEGNTQKMKALVKEIPQKMKALVKEIPQKMKTL